MFERCSPILKAKAASFFIPPMKSLCITLGPDWPLAQQEFERVGLKVEKFDAICEDNRVLSFNKSVYGCMKLAEGQDLLLFEDDVVFDPTPSINLKNVPEGFMTVQLGCNILGFDTTILHNLERDRANNIVDFDKKWYEPTYHSREFAKLNSCTQSHATLYSAECVKYIIENFKFVTDEYKREGCEIFDDWLRRHVLPQGRSYVFRPMIAFQRPRWSEIWNCESNYTYCHLEGNVWLKKNL